MMNTPNPATETAERTPDAMLMQLLTLGYKECVLFTETADDDTPLDEMYTPEDFTAEAQVHVHTDLLSFWRAAEAQAPGAITLENARRAGMDLWYTRNGHGTGFWDQDEALYGSAANRDVLDALARSMGELDACDEGCEVGFH